MKVNDRLYFLTIAIIVGFIFVASELVAEDAAFHNAPPDTLQVHNPYAGEVNAITAGSRLYAANCGSCHGIKGRGTENIPALAEGSTQTASDGEIFWFITRGAAGNGMPSWATLSERQRWQIVTYLKSLKGPA
jgi:mono/diheme cytochrome c family protein